MKYSDSLSRLVTALFAIAWCGILLYPVYDAAIFAALSRGTYILHHPNLPSTYLWSAVGEGSPMWPTLIPFDVLVAKLQELYGDGGILALKGAVYVLEFAALVALFRRNGTERFYAALLAMIVATGLFSSSAFGPRQTSYLVWTLLLCVAPPRSHLWVFPTALAIIACTLGGELSSSSIAHRGVSNLLSYEFAGVMLLGALTIITARRSQPKLLAGAIGLGAVAVAIGSLVPFCLIGMGLLCSSLWRNAEQRAGEDPIVVGLRKLREKLQALHPVGVVWILGCVCFVNYSRLTRGIHVTSELFSKHEIDELLDRGEIGPRVFANPELSSYLMLRLANATGTPERLVVADLESARYAPSEYLNALRASAGDERSMELLDRYRVSTVLCRSNGPLCRWLSGQSSWRLIENPPAADQQPKSSAATPPADPEITVPTKKSAPTLPNLRAFERVS